MCSCHENWHVLTCFWTALDLSGIKERTLVAVKPDGVQRRLIGDVIKRFEQRGFRLVGLKMLQVRDSHTRRSWVCVTCLYIMCLCVSGFWQAFSSALHLAAEETLLLQPAVLHDLWPCGRHGTVTGYEYHTAVILILQDAKSANP